MICLIIALIIIVPVVTYSLWLGIASIRHLTRNKWEGVWLSVDDFNALKSIKKDFKGIYIFYNETKQMYYVGQSIHVIQRVKKHLSGYGNGDVYVDIKNGDIFKICLEKFRRTDFISLNKMERHYIEKYDACDNGYNRTKGNK